MTQIPSRIGFVGVGRMGANMARRVHEAGYQVVACFDVDPTPVARLAHEIHCGIAASPKQVAEASDIIFTVITDDMAMRQIYSEHNPDSLLSQARNKVFINCATLSPHLHIEVERLVEQHGGQTLEACMASSIPQAREGTLYLMCGGKQKTFEHLQPLLATLSATLRYIGPAGEAAKVKALVNMVMNINTAGLAEGLGLGAALGLDLTMLQEVFGQTGAASRVLETDGPDMQNRDHECYFSAEHAAKDSGIALSLAESVDLNLPLAKATWDQYQQLIQSGKGALDKSAVAELIFKNRMN